MIIRQFEEGQLTELLDLFNISMPRDKFSKELLIENVIDDMIENPELCLAAYKDEMLIGFGMGVIRHRDNENMGYIKFMCVHPNHRREGIAKDIYSRIEKGITQKGIDKIRLVESWPNYYMPGIDPFYTEAVAFFERLGYIKIGDAANLICDLENQNFDTINEESNLAKNIEIRRAEKIDYDDLMNWADKNFAAWKYEMENALRKTPVSLHLAKLDGEIIAFSAHSSNNPGLPWYGPVGTTEAARGKGVGGILLKRCLNDMKESGLKKAIIPWVAHIPFYMHYINSKVDRVFWRYEKEFK
ncbi:MAG: GNAT family N-acetyltransferase [Bacteroidota bacterium]